MPDPRKHFFSPSLVHRLAGDVARVHPAFPRDLFLADALATLEARELLDRSRHIARALAKHLPRGYPAAVDVLIRSLGPEHATDELLGTGMDRFYYLPHVQFVAEHGLEHFDLSLDAQRELTKRFSAEFSIRAFIARDPERTFAAFERWAFDRDAHVRRLVSEGTRLRLPWAARVAWLDRNPERIVALLELVKDDPTTLVRRSVANNLNDLGKSHPELLRATCVRWLEGAGAERRKLIAHALRSALRRGEAGAHSLLGYGSRASVVVEEVRIAPTNVPIGERVAVTFTLRSTARSAQSLSVDLVVHFVKASGMARPKVFKVKRLELAPHASAELRTTVSLAVHSTRKPRPGRHAIEIRVNGVAFPAGSFEVTVARP